MRHSFKLRDLVESLKQCFVKIAVEELENLGETVTASKISAMTGIQRPEVTRLMNDDPSSKRDVDVIARVTGLWQASSRYKDKAGRPRILELKGREGDFARLVENVSTDLNPYTVAFELERAGIAKQTEQGMKLLKPGHEARADIEKALGLLSQDLSDLYAAVDENLFDKPKDPNLHAKTDFDNIPASKLHEVRDWFLRRGEAIHKESREFLSRYDRDINPQLKKLHPNEPAIRAVIGTYSYTEEMK